MSAASDVNRIVTGYYTAQDAIEYAESFVLEAQENEDDDYTMVWMSAYSGTFPPEK